MSSEKSDRFLADLGINSAQVLSKSIAKAAESDWKHNHSIPESLISTSIILPAYLFGSVYLFSTSLIGFNKKWIKDNQVFFGPFEIINGSLLSLSGILMVSLQIKRLGSSIKNKLT